MSAEEMLAGEGGRRGEGSWAEPACEKGKKKKKRKTERGGAGAETGWARVEKKEKENGRAWWAGLKEKKKRKKERKKEGKREREKRNKNLIRWNKIK